MTPPAPAQLPQQRRHTTATVLLARTMYGDGDSWTPTQIVRYLTEQGTPVSLNTVRCWVVPGHAEEHRRQNRRTAAARRQREEREGSRATPVLNRMRQLRAAGMPFASIAIVLRLDWGLDISADQVRYYMRKGREPRLPKRKAARDAA